MSGSESLLQRKTKIDRDKIRRNDMCIHKKNCVYGTKRAISQVTEINRVLVTGTLLRRR